MHLVAITSEKDEADNIEHEEPDKIFQRHAHSYILCYKEESGWIRALGAYATTEKPMSADCTVNPGLVKLKELELRRFTIKIRNQLGDRFHAKYVD